MLRIHSVQTTQSEPKTYQGIGYCWHQQHELDGVGLASDGTLVAGECKHTSREMAEGSLAGLERSELLDTGISTGFRPVFPPPTMVGGTLHLRAGGGVDVTGTTRTPGVVISLASGGLESSKMHYNNRR